MTRTIVTTILIGAMLTLTACGGGRTNQTTTTTVKATTTGQELADLQTALDEGLITEREFNQKREEILEGS